ncbi:hypothetical protein HBA54_03895 [Pelagibius litoralis]|uniref:Intein N-terminal splicing region n=1 Tax=Pelagibius litoralis TaxID=374515 RepID=A0A967CAW3_9PROT|nr:Hint domain-containing protein [Pelagibius litoralis]NIA67724.1 hypothetical protein [Pelagibius litoralis]
MKQSNRAFTRLMASTSLIALSLTIAPIALSPDIGGASLGFADSGSSCFVAGTRVLMADGSEKAIECIEVGEAIRNGRGGISRVRAIERPALGTRLLFAFNGSRPFVTAEHPFLTMMGWKAVDPAATARENPSLPVLTLRQGDLLTRAHPARSGSVSGNLALADDIEYALEPLRRLTASAAPPETVVYNLILEGDRSFIADGYVVHNKGGEGGESGGDSGGESGGGDSGGGGESGGGNSGSGGGGESGESDSSGEGGESGESDSSGEGGESGESGSSDEGGESGESGSSGEGGESGDSGESGESGEAGEFSGDAGEAGEDLNDDEEADLIRRGWQ